MKKILITTTVAQTIKAFLLPYVDYLRQEGWQVDGMARNISQSEECVKAFDNIFEIDWSRNPLSPSNFIYTPAKIRKIVSQQEYDIVHVHTPVAAFVTRYALRNQRLKENTPKVIYTAHGFHFYKGGPWLKNRIFMTLEKIAGKWTDHLIVINNEDYNSARRQNIVPASGITFMPGIGIDTTLYDPQAVTDLQVQQVRDELNISAKEPFFLMIAEFIKRKHHSDILKAFSLAKEKSCHIVFAGEGPLLNDMKNLSKKLGIEKRVHFAGHREDIPILIKASTATILPSEQEGLPRSVMESMALATPVIGTRIRGTEDLLKRGAGLLVKTGNIKGLAGAIDWIIRHPEKSLRMGKTGQKNIKDYDIQRTIAIQKEIMGKMSNMHF